MSDTQLVLELNFEYSGVVAGISEIQDAMSGLERSMSLSMNAMVQMTDAEKALTSQTDSFERALGVSSTAANDLKTETDALVKVINNNADAFENNKAKADLARQSIQEQIDKYNKFGEEVPPNLEAVRELLKDTTEKGMSIGDIGTHLKNFADYASQVVGPLMDMAGASARTKEQVNGMIDGVSKVGEGLTQLATNPVAGTINIITGALKFGLNAWQMWKDQGVRAAIAEERKLIDISAEVEEKIVKLADKLNDAHAATSVYMAEIIKGAKINESNFDNYVSRTSEIIDDYKNKKLDLDQTQEALGKSFTAILTEAQKLGTEGSAEMVTLIERIQSSGIKVGEVMGYVNQQIEKGTQAMSKYLSTFNITSITKSIADLKKELEGKNLTQAREIEIQEELKKKQLELAMASEDVQKNWSLMETVALAAFDQMEKGGGNFVENVIKMQDQLVNFKTIAGAAGIEIKGRLKEMVDVAAFLDQNKVLTFRLEQTKELMESLGGTAGASQELFTKFSSYVVDAYNDMIAGGLGNEKALQLLKPQLEKINEIAGQYKVTISEQTENLLEKGRTAEVIAKKEKENFERVHDFLLGSVRLFKEELPEAAEVGLGKIGRTIDVEGIKKNLRTVIESVQKQFAEPGMGGYQLNLSFGETERWVSDILPSFMEFLEVLDNEYGINLDFTDASKSIDQVRKHIKIFSDSVKEKLGWNFDETSAMSSIGKLIRGFGLVQKEIEKERKLRVDSKPAEMSIEGVSTAFALLGNMFLMPFGVNVDTSHAQAALVGLYQSFAQMMQGFLEPMGINIDFSSIISSLIGIQNVQKDVKSGTTVLTEEQKKWKIAVAETSEKYNILEGDAVKPTRMLKEETAKVLAVLAKNKAAFENNAVGAEKLRAMLRDHLELYEKYKKDPPEALNQAIESTNTLTKAQQAARDSAQSLLETYGFLGDDALNKLNMESEALIDKIIEMTNEGKLNEEQQKKLGEAFQAQLDKYPDLTKASAKVQLVSDAWGFLEIGATKSNKAIQDEIAKTIKENEALDKSMGFLVKGDIEKGLNDLTSSLSRNKDQLQDNPELVKKLYGEMETLEKNAEKLEYTLPATWEADTQALREAQEATEQKEKKTKSLADTYGYTAKQIEKMSEKEREAAEAMSETVKGIMDIGSALGVSTKDMQGFAQGWISMFHGGGSITDKMQTFGKMTGLAGNMLKDMGIVSGSVASRIALVGQGIGQVGSGVAGLLSGNPMKMIEGVIKIAKGIGKIIKGLFGDKWERRAKKALKGLEGVTDEMTQQLKKKAKEMGSTTLAMNELMASFIKQAAITTEKGLEGWSGKVVGMMDQLKNVSGADAAKLTQQIGDSFSAMVEKADKLDLHGSKAMVSMIQKARELKKEGKEIPEVFEYVTERLNKGAEAIKTYIDTFGDVGAIQKGIGEIGDKLRAGNLTAAEAAKLQGELAGKQTELNTAIKDIRQNWDFIQTASLSTFTAMMDSGKSFVEVVREMGDQLTGLGDMAKLSGLEISGGLKEMTDLADFVKQNEKLSTRIEATNQMMEALGDTSYMTGEDFTNFSTNALKQFDDLINAGAEEKQALRLLGPQLENLIKYEKTYGYTIDAQTKALIDRAKQQGVLGKQQKTEGEQQIDLQERMVSILEGIGEHFGVKIPDAMDEMASSGERSMGSLEAHWESMDMDVEMVREKLLKGLPFSYRAMAEAAIAARQAADATPTIESIDDWKFSLEDVEDTIKTKLIDANQELDDVSKTTIGNMVNYLINTSEEGRKTTMTFGDIKAKLEELGGSYSDLVEGSPELFLQVSDKMKERIDELTATMGDSHAATSTLMSQIIAQAEIDVTNFDLYAARTKEIIDDYKSGALDLEQTTEAMGAAFNNILGEAQRLGTEGTQHMVEMLQAAREAGLEVAEMHEYVNSKLQDGVAALTTYIESFESSDEKGSKKKEEIAANWEFMQAMALASFQALQEQGFSFVETLNMMQQPLADLGQMAKDSGLEVSEGLRRMTNIAVFNEQNQALISRIEATRGMMEALGDSAFLTANDFAMFAQQTMSQFDEVLAKSGDQETALRLVAPALEDLIKYADSYGFAIDDNTQALIDQGIQQGLVSEQTKTDAQVTNDLLLLIAETLGATIPDNLRGLTGEVQQSMTAIEGQTGAWNSRLHDVEDQLATRLPKAIKDLDAGYTDAMTGHSIVTETGKWQLALENVKETISNDLEQSAIGLDSVFGAVMHRLVYFSGDLATKLKETAEEGGDLQAVFDEYAAKIGITAEQLKNVLDIAAGQVITISDEMQAKIDELTETMGDAHAAESTLMNEIIRDADMTVGNFDTYAQRTREILADYNSGALDLKQTQEAMGSSFSELLKKAQELGTEGSKQMIALLKDVRTSGIEVAEMQDYVNDKLNKGVDALDKYISSFKSTTTLTDEYDDLNKKLSDNLEALEKVEAEMLEGGKTQQELNDLRKEATRLEEERAKLLDDTIAKENELGTAQKDIAENWNFMQAATLSTFKALESEGHSFVEIVGKMDGQLTNLAHMAEENGLTVSEGIKDMTDMAAFVEQNEGLANRIDATKTMMEALGDTAYMKAGDFAMFSDQTKKQFDEIIAKGGDSQMALRLMAPALEDLVKYSESYGYTIDANTQSLIDQAREQGLLSEQQKTDAQVTNDILLLIAETMGAVIPESMKGMSDAMTDTVEGMDQKTAQLDESLTGLGQTAVEKGIEVKEGLKEMTDMEAIDEENLAMLEKIEATREMMAQLGESAYMTGDDFAQFSEMTREQFMEMAAKTGDHEAALHLLGPALDDLTKYSEKFGFAVDDNTQSLIDQANQQEELAKKTEDGTKAANQHLMEMAKKYGLEIPDSLKVLTDDVKDSMNKIEEKTGDWNSSLDDVEGKIKEDLPRAIRDLDADYTDAMTGHSIVTETGKWKHSLEDVNHILGRELLETAENLNQKYKHVSGNIYQYLQKTSKGGYMARMSFDQMVKELEKVKNAYDKMAIKKRLSDRDKNIMEDYKRQIEELSEAIEETAPTLENFGKKFKEFQDKISGDIGVNRGMIEMARGLREQGQSLKEIDDIIDKSLTGGSKGLGAWVNALGPAKEEIEELKKLQEEINELREKEELKEDELAKLEKMEADLLNRRTDAQKLFLQDQEELLNTQDMVVAYFHSMRAEGKSVSEIMEIMGDSFENLAEKSMAQLTGTAGFEMTDAFSNLYNMQRKMADNEDLIEGVEGLTQALHGMGDSMLYMSDEEFGRFESSAVSAFKKLKDAGFDQKQSLQLIAPMLKDLKSYAAEYGFSLDKSTARMLKNAQKEGVLRKKQKSDTEKLVEVNQQLASVMERVAGSLEKLGTVSPFAQLADEAQALETQTARLKGFERQRRTVARDIELAKSQAQRLIDDLAAAGGVSTETGTGLFERLLKKEEELEKLMKKQTDIERGYNRTRADVERLREEYNKNMPKEGDYISAALGYHGILERDKWFRLHKDEQVDVWTPEETRKIQATPIRRMNLSDTQPGRTPKGDIVFEHITIQSENGDEAVKEFMTAIKGNKYGVQNLIRKVAQ